MSDLSFPEKLEAPKENKADKDKAPRGTTARKPPAGRQAPLQKRLQETIGGIGLAVVFVNEVDGLAIVQGAERLSIALDRAAQQSPAVRRTLEMVLATGVWTEVAVAMGMIVVPIAVNHSMLPSSIAAHFAAVPTPNANGNGPDFAD